MQKTFNVYADPGHAWARVPRGLLSTLGIEQRVTPYSYQRGQFAYLEEDCDLSLFIQAYRQHTGQDPAFRESHTDKYSKIRGYASYKTQGA